MMQQSYGLKDKAQEYIHETDSVRNKRKAGLKNHALKHDHNYHVYMDSKRNKVNSLEVDICQSRKEKKEVLPILQDKIEPIQREKKGLPSPYECAEQLKARVHFISYNDKLYYYNGICYDLLKTDDIIRLYRDKVDETLGYERNLNLFTHVRTMLSTDSSIKVKRLEDNNRIVVLRNGIYDVEKGKLRLHSHKEIVFSYVNANYVRDEKCKHFDNFIESVTEGDKVLKERLWMFIGYLLMQTLEAKVFFIMGEAPDSGKSLLGNFIESLFPTEYVSNIALTDMNKPFSVAPIAGSAINISLDLPSTKLNAVAVSNLKMFTGGDTFNINEKFEKVYRYENRAKLVFASNFPISLIENDNAFWNRLVYLPFKKSVPKEEQDRELLKKLQKEKNAIVSKAILYAQKLIEADFQFPTTPYIECKMAEWRGISCKSIENFLGDCCHCDSTYEGELTETLYNEYIKYCDFANYVAVSRSKFIHFLENSIGLKNRKKRIDGAYNPRSSFEGIMLRDTVESLRAESMISALQDEIMY